MGSRRECSGRVIFWLRCFSACARVYVYVYVCVHVRVCACACVPCTCVCVMHVFGCICTRVRVCVHECTSSVVVVYYCRTYEKAVSGGGEREKGGHVLRDTTSRGLYVQVWPPHTSERRGGGGGCEQEGWQGGEGRARMSGQEERQRHIRRC